MSGIVLGFDATGANYAHLPAGQHAGYVTGSGGVPWTAAQWTADPGSVRIDQSPVNTAPDELADVLDVENGAATLADVAPWAFAATANFIAGRWPGQRSPAVYCSQDSVTPVVNALTAGGINSGVGLWIANWGVSEASAVALVAAASGPFPVIGLQFADTGGAGLYDLDVFSTAWLAGQSGAAGSTVAEGSSGPAVLALQQRLAVWGHAVTADGLFGPATLAAVQAFQGAAQLTADGIAGPATWTALDASPSPSAPPGTVPAPLDLRQAVASAGVMTVTFTWGAVPGVSAYRVQAEWYSGHSGWLLSADHGGVTGLRYSLALVPQGHFRWRVAADVPGHAWPDWVQFTTP